MNVKNTLKLWLKKVLSLQLGEVATDKGQLFWDGDADLKAGDEVFVEGEGEMVPAADGEYVTEDGKTIVVAEGKVAEIKDPEAEVAPEGEESQESEIAAEEETPEADPADAEEVESVSIEDRVAALESRLNEFIEGLNQIVNAIAALEDRISVAESKLASVEEPAADPIVEEPAEVEQKKTRLSYMRKK